MCKEIAVLFGRPWSVSGPAAATSWPWRRRSGELRFEERFGSLHEGPGRQDEPGGAAGPGRGCPGGRKSCNSAKRLDSTRCESSGEGGRPTAGTGAGTDKESGVGRLDGAPPHFADSAAGSGKRSWRRTGHGGSGAPSCSVPHHLKSTGRVPALPPVARVAGEAAVCGILHILWCQQWEAVASRRLLSEIQVAPKPAQIDKMALRAPQLSPPSHKSCSQLGGVSNWVGTVGRGGCVCVCVCTSCTKRFLLPQSSCCGPSTRKPPLKHLDTPVP